MFQRCLRKGTAKWPRIRGAMTAPFDIYELNLDQAVFLEIDCLLALA